MENIYQGESRRIEVAVVDSTGGPANLMGQKHISLVVRFH